MDPLLFKKNNISIEGNLQAHQTLVFVHGFGTDQTSWDPVKHAFEKDYKLVLLDNVGAGKSDPNAYSPIKYNVLNSYANDLADILDMLNLENAILIGHSVGSMVSLLAALKLPHRVSKLVLIAASPRYLDDPAEGYTGGFTQQALDSMYEAMTTNYYAWASGFSAIAMGNPDKPELGAYFANALSAIRPDIALAVSKVIFESDTRKELSKLNKEVLLLQSRKDVAVPDEVGKYLHKNIINSKLEYLDSTGHFPHISAPQEVIRNIQSFIK